MKRLLRFKGEYLSTKDMSCEVEAGLLDMNGCDLVAPILLPPSVFVLALPHACLYMATISPQTNNLISWKFRNNIFCKIARKPLHQYESIPNGRKHSDIIKLNSTLLSHCLEISEEKLSASAIYSVHI